MYGWRGRIGHLHPSAGLAGEPELRRLVPDGVEIYTTRLKMPRATPAALEALADYAEDAAILVADARVDVIAFNCTAASLIKGTGYDREIIGRIEAASGTPATTTTTAVLAALSRLSARRLVLLTPYKDEVHEVEVRFLQDQGLEVLAQRNLGIDEPYHQAAISPDTWYRHLRELRHPDAEVYFVSCAGIQVVEIIAAAEADLGRPVITSNQALAWHCLDRLGVASRVPGYGALMAGVQPLGLPV